MVNELNINQTVQAEVGEFNTLEAEELIIDTLSVDSLTATGDVSVGGALTVDNNVTVKGTFTSESNAFFDASVDINFGLDVGQGIDVQNIVRAKDFKSGTWSGSTFTEDYSLDAVGALANDNKDRLDAAGLFIASAESRLTALEEASSTSPIPDDLSTTVQAIQTRIGTLESLIGLLTNNNTNDTAIEHRITRIEQAITALKAVHDAKRAVYNIPLDW